MYYPPSRSPVRFILTSALALCPALAGCSAAPEDSSDQSAAAATTTTTWTPVLTCNHGLTIDADQNERRNLQAVIRDPGAVAWLSARPGAGGIGTKNEKGEIVLKGTVTKGVFGPADFTSFAQTGFFARDSNDPAARVTRIGNDGVRVQLVSFATGKEVEASNWVFRNCH